MDPLGTKILPHLEAHATRLKEHDKRVIREQKEFASFDFEKVGRMEPAELSEFQSRFLPSSPQFIVAAQIWNTNLIKDHIKAIDAHSKGGTKAAIIAALIAGFLGLAGGLCAPLVAAKIGQASWSKNTSKRQTDTETKVPQGADNKAISQNKE